MLTRQKCENNDNTCWALSVISLWLGTAVFYTMTNWSPIFTSALATIFGLSAISMATILNSMVLFFLVVSLLLVCKSFPSLCRITKLFNRLDEEAQKEISTIRKDFLIKLTLGVGIGVGCVETGATIILMLAPAAIAAKIGIALVCGPLIGLFPPILTILACSYVMPIIFRSFAKFEQDRAARRTICLPGSEPISDNLLRAPPPVVKAHQEVVGESPIVDDRPSYLASRLH